jgi:hypothetical protein
MHSFRAFASGKATWILNYSWDGDKKVDARPAMQNLAMSQIMTGSNFWDAPGHSMAGSNNVEMRTKIFSWIEKHQETFYRPRSPINPVGVYFSPKTRDYHGADFISSYRGCLILLMQKHWEFQVVTPRTLADFKGDTLILPDVREMSDPERTALKTLASGGKRIVISGENSSGLAAGDNVSLLPDCPCRKYEKSLDPNLENGNPDRAQELLSAIRHQSDITITAPATAATSIAEVDGKQQIFIANFTGLRGGVNPLPTPQKEISVRLRSAKQVRWLPFMGDAQEIRNEPSGDGIVYRLPNVDRGGVVSVER